MKKPWKVSGGTWLSITSIRQKANMRRTRSLPYIEDKVTHSWVNGSLRSQRIPENGLSWMLRVFSTLPGGRTVAAPSFVPLLTLLPPDLWEKLLWERSIVAFTADGFPGCWT